MSSVVGAPAAVDAGLPSYLASLSKAQYDAVTASPDVPLQILAGPGSGKTRVLVARVTWLILANNIRPNDLVVVTFTNKAANEMRQRLQKLIGPERTANLILGTFHATCARYLRRNAKAVDLQNNFSICDADESKKVLKTILKNKKDALEAMGLPSNLKVEQVMSEISRAKAKDMGPEQYMAFIKKISAARSDTNRSGRVESTIVRRAAAEIYFDYQAYLKSNNAVDFDDLLVYGVRLFRDSPDVISNAKHVLVDEFQDTNAIQYQLMSELAGPNGSRHSVSVVGDPDQSIYGWRSAEVGNLALMKHDFGGKRTKDGVDSEGVKQVFLEESYRSTGHILKAAKSIIEGDSNRIDRGLYTSHPIGSKVVLKRHASSQHEASFVALEIKRLVAHSGGLLNYDDFAILLRYNALSREVERQLQTENIPSRMMGGARFFERKEVKDILAYLTLADNPLFTPALERVINVPKRGIGDKAFSDLKEMAEEQGVRTMEIVEQVADADKPILGVKPGVQKSLKAFLDVVKEIRLMALAHVPVATIIETLIKSIHYESFLKKEDDFAQRWENVKELINFSTIVAQVGTAVPFESSRGQSSDDDDELDDDQMNYEAEGGSVSWGSLSTTVASNEDLASSFSGDVHKSGIGSTVKSETGGSSKRNKRQRKTLEIIDLISSEEEEDVKPVVKKAREGKKEQAKRKAASAKKEVEPEPEEAAAAAEEEPEVVATSNIVIEEGTEVKSPLRIFLEASTLSTDMEQDDQDGKSPKVTIATTHAAKGLEFPVVFILSVENGTFPFFRCTSEAEINEECRLLYVAVTRAQTHLYINYCSTRMSYGETRDQELSPFVARVADAKLFRGGQWKEASSDKYTVDSGGFMGPGAAISSSSLAALASRKVEKIDFARSRPQISMQDRLDIASVLDRKPVDESVAAELIAKFDNSNAGARSEASDASISARDEVRGNTFNLNNNRLGGGQPSSGFTSARNLVTTAFTPVGSSILSSNGVSKKYDKDGWATGTATRAAPQHSIGSSRPSTSSFMDEYRLSKNHLAHEGMTMNGLLGLKKAKTDVNSFQSKNEESLKGFMSMLPADVKPAASNQASKVHVAGSSSVNPTPPHGHKKRLGMGRPR
ncbi:hypothetical protein CBS101457_005678 [Exobasidium rhododendri]|nr:hypothetical protein CBS101457_005678 [Exobasidium rhododendri]